MKSRPTIFVSAVSGELRSFRQAVRDVLLAKNVFPIVQDNFPTDGRQVREMLAEHIAKSDAVICLVGFAFGAEPRDRPVGESRRSYTQLEYDLAREFGKPISVFLTDEQARPCDADPNEDKERRRLQIAFRAGIRSGDALWQEFATLEELKVRVARIPIVLEAEFKISSGGLLCSAGHRPSHDQGLADAKQTIFGL